MLHRLAIAAAIAALTTAAAVAQGPAAPGALPAPVDSGYAPTNGVEVYYQVYGEGEPIVLLHGGLGFIESFGAIIPLLAADHKVVGIDLQAHGRTLPFDRPMSFEAMADDIAGVLDHLGVAEADIMGYSLGGGVALRVAIQHPDIVDRLILVSAPFAYAGWHDYNQEGMRAMNAGIAEVMMQTPLYDLYAAIAPDPANFPVLLDKIGELPAADYDWSDEVGALEMPVLLIAGDWDSVRMDHLAQFFMLLGGGLVDAGPDHAAMNESRLAVLPGQTHYTILSAPELGQLALSFIEGELTPVPVMAPPPGG